MKPDNVFEYLPPKKKKEVEEKTKKEKAQEETKSPNKNSKTKLQFLGDAGLVVLITLSLLYSSAFMLGELGFYAPVVVYKHPLLGLFAWPFTLIITTLFCISVKMGKQLWNTARVFLIIFAVIWAVSAMTYKIWPEFKPREWIGSIHLGETLKSEPKYKVVTKYRTRPGYPVSFTGVGMGTNDKIKGMLKFGINIKLKDKVVVRGKKFKYLHYNWKIYYGKAEYINQNSGDKKLGVRAPRGEKITIEVLEPYLVKVPE